ncbi:MAG TPA: AbrB/MazE/SpoVT family DNA-binding domain-containing protein [Noviherbaspirillum sp.]|nr:AbrB/MazE/SpoVT family DNA-binding domain-containing protein [Noviherbaspirillum sp.]
MHALKLIRIGDAVGVVLPREALARLQRGTGEIVFLTESHHGLTLTADDPVLQKQLDVGREFIGAYRGALKALQR